MILEVASVWKAAAALGCLGGSWTVWQRMPSNVARANLSECFLRAGLFAKKNEAKLYPSIKSVRFYADRLQMVFTLPVGLDPKDVSKAEYVFKQQFGEHVQLEKGVKVFTLNVYQTSIALFKYDLTEFVDLIGQMHVPIVVGLSRSGWEVYDMAEHPHLLDSGETGSGKSVWLRQCLTTLIQVKQPNQLHLYLCDLKMSEFHIFEGVAHVQFNDHDVSKIRAVLQKLKKELKKRGKLCKDHGVANVLEIPEKERPPFILLCIDEVALLRDESDIMEVVYDIGATGRSNGVFLLLSMQRPDSKLLEGALKQCLTVRISGKQPDELNSRIALDAPDAAHIKQPGQMVYKMNRLVTVQAPYLKIKEAEKLLDPYKTKQPRGDIIDVEHEVVEEEVIGVLE